MYAAFATQPDKFFAVAALSQYRSWQFNCYMTADESVRQYVKSTANIRLHSNGNCIITGISFGNGIGIHIDIQNSLVGYSDSNWADDSVEYKSHRGHVFLASSGALSRQAQKQHIITMSTLEANFISCSDASTKVT